MNLRDSMCIEGCYSEVTKFPPKTKVRNFSHQDKVHLDAEEWPVITTS